MMKRVKKITLCLAGTLALSAGLRADTVPLNGNPYALVVARNIFGLDPPVVVDPNHTDAEPPLKITPNGIMSVFGQVQVLFKVAGRPPAKENSYMLTEGQREDDIEVVKIDEKNGVVTFNNHGQAQVLSLAAPPATAGAGLSGGNPGIPGAPGVPAGGNFGNSGFNNAFGGHGLSGGNNNPTASAGNGSNLRPIPTRANPADQQPAMTPEQQVIMIEAQRMQYQSVGDPISKILPPTPLTPAPDSGDANPTPEP